MTKQEDFKIGDIVKIRSAGNSYTTYPTWAERAGATKYLGQCPQVGKEYTLKHIAPHGDDTEQLLGLLEDKNGNQYIFGLYGDIYIDKENIVNKLFNQIRSEVENE